MTHDSNTRLRLTLSAMIVLTLHGINSPDARAADARVELELITEQGSSPLAPQKWIQDLSRQGVSNVRVRSGRSGETPTIDRRGLDSAPVFAVRGVIDRSGVLVLPGGKKFRQGQASSVAAWINDLATQGPESERSGPKRYGLERKQFEQVFDDLATPINFPTADTPRGATVRRIASLLKHPLVIDPVLLEVMNSDPLEEELQEMSCGTALAFALSKMRLGLYPEPADDGSIRYAVRSLGRADTPGPGNSTGSSATSSTKKNESELAWPIGWETKMSTKSLIPKALEQLNASAAGVPVTKVISAVSVRIETPILLDYQAIRRESIDPEKINAQIKPRQMMYATFLNQALFQARLKAQLRVDEAGRGFLLVTTIKQASN